jgi:hypothetical protein
VVLTRSIIEHCDSNYNKGQSRGGDGDRDGVGDGDVE